jgi:hypothetical protein
VTLTLAITASSDDVNEVDGTLTPDAATVWLGNGGSTTGSYTGLRFASVGIPKNAIINTATLQVISSQKQDTTIAFSIAADATGNSPTFASVTKPSLRAQTSNKVNHNSSVRWLAGKPYTLDEIKVVIQEIVSRADWQSGNGLSLIMKGASAGSLDRKFIKSFDGGGAAKLVVTYTPN